MNIPKEKQAVLKAIGLTDGEIKTYLALLELGSSSTGPIAKKSQVSRSKLYSILDKLEKKGLVSHMTKQGITYFQAAEPEKINSYLEEKKKSMKKVEDSFQKILPYLKQVQQLAGQTQSVTVYQGLKGLQTAHEHVYQKLKPKESYYYLGIPKEQPITHHLYWKRDHHRRIKAKIKAKLLFNRDTPREIIENRNQFSGCEAKLMPIGVKTPSYILIYADVTTIIVPSKEPLAIEITSTSVAESFKAYFNEFWNKAKSEKRFD